MGIRTTRDGNDCKIGSLFEKGVAHRAGLSAGDVLTAIDGLRVTATNLTDLLRRYRAGDTVTVHAFRRDELMSFSAKLALDDTPKIQLESQQKPSAAVKLRQAWLGSLIK